MLTLYRRHLKTCVHRGEGREYRRCRCPLWVDGFLGKQEVRKSLKLRDWTRACQQIQEWEAAGTFDGPERAEPTAIEQACASFLADATARELREPTLYKYRLLFRQLANFARSRGIRYMPEFTLEMAREFRISWADHNSAAKKKLERLRAFLRFAQESGWIADNVGRKLKNPKTSDPPHATAEQGRRDRHSLRLP